MVLSYPMLPKTVRMLGRGSNGTAYLCDDGNVLKVTRSPGEAASWDVTSGLNWVPRISRSLRLGDSEWAVLREMVDPLEPTEIASIPILEEVTALDRASDAASLTIIRHPGRRARFISEYLRRLAEAVEHPLCASVARGLLDLHAARKVVLMDAIPAGLGRTKDGKIVAFDIEVPMGQSFLYLNETGPK